MVGRVVGWASPLQVTAKTPTTILDPSPNHHFGPSGPDQARGSKMVGWVSGPMLKSLQIDPSCPKWLRLVSGPMLKSLQMVTWCHEVEMREISTRMLRGRFWLENQDFGVSFGAICIIFRATSFPTSPRSQNRLFQKNVPDVQGRRYGRGKNCLHFWGPMISALMGRFAMISALVPTPTQPF